jgi:hypothetical protein
MINGSHYQLTENGRQPDDGLGQPNPFPLTPDEVVRRGQEAMERKRRSFDDFMFIAEALEVGCTEVMRAVHTHKPTGRHYAKAMDEWLFAHSFHLIDKCTRSHLLECRKHRAEIDKWRATLTEAERFNFNHPTTVLRRWKAATIVPDPNTPRKPSAVSKLKDTIIQLEEENHRMQHEIARGGGDLWTVDDTPDDIARVMLDKLPPNKAERVARTILRKLTDNKAGVKARRPTAMATQGAE